jgi:hypothetical protein
MRFIYYRFYYLVKAKLRKVKNKRYQLLKQSNSSLSQISAKAPEMIKSLQELVGVYGNILMLAHPILSETKSALLIYDLANSKSKVG